MKTYVNKLSKEQLEELTKGLPVYSNGLVYRIHPHETGKPIEDIVDTDLLVHDEDDLGIVVF